MSRLRSWAKRIATYLRDPWTVSRGLTLVFLSVGLTLLLSALISPLWVLDLAFRYAPNLVLDLIDLLGLDSQQIVIAYGGLLTLGAIALFVASEVRARRRGAQTHQLRERMRLAFLATASFVAGFVGARAIVVLSGIATSAGGSSGSAGGLPVRELWLGGYHIHHFFYGFLLLVIAGWIGLFHPKISKRLVAILYGLGLGIFVDEWGLLVTMEDYYARSSWFAGIVFLSLLVLAMILTFGAAPGEPEPDDPPDPGASGGGPVTPSAD